ncbi:flagellar biosynthetic protein FliR [Pseudooceanicola sp. C21-150M6]|uniref:flagellar biosynthetic protein FliR n=1 Tax=Pseudooceanicola sp. C21-150M6 TaxID=3434355 RepID=UPI003D7F7BE0
MTALLLSMLEGGGEIFDMFIAGLRFGPVLFLLPGVPEFRIPAWVKIGVLISVSAILYPSVGTVVLGSDTLWSIVLIETFIGICLGMGVRLFLMALQIAGSIAAQSTSLFQVGGASMPEPMPALGMVWVVAALAFAASYGFHIKAIEYMMASYSVMPVGHLPGRSDLVAWFIGGVSTCFSLGFVLSAPFLILAAIYNLTLGVINRAMPQLMVAFVGAPVIVFGAQALLLVSSSSVLKTWWVYMEQSLYAPFGLAP